MVRRYKVRTRFFVLALPDLAKPVKKIVLENLENQFVPDSWTIIYQSQFKVIGTQDRGTWR